MLKQNKRMRYLLLFCLISMLSVFGLCSSVYGATVGKPVMKSAKVLAYNKLELSWNKVSGASGYAVLQSTSKSGPFKTIKTVSSKTTNLTVSNLACGRSYYFRVRAYKTVKGKKQYGSYSSTQKVTPVPLAPKIKTVQLLSKSSAKLTWYYTSGADGYYIYRSEKSSSGYTRIATIKNKNTKEYLDTKFVSGKNYYYKVVAYHDYKGTISKGKSSDYIMLQTKVAYTVTPSSKPYAGRFTAIPEYNETTRIYYMLRSYMEHFADMGGGELVLKGGEYKITQPIYVPSNVTLILSDGVTIKNTGDKSNKALIVLADIKVMSSGQKYTRYNGVHDVKIIGQGSAVLDKEFKKHSAILVGHTRNVLIQGITFKNMLGSTHFIELDASQNVEIADCTFTQYKDDGAGKEAINIDVPDPNTGGFSGTFSSLDKTPNDGIYIHNNVFSYLPTAVGTHMYTPGSAHKNVRIVSNRIENCGYYGIRAMNWKDSLIADNTISGVRKSAMDTEQATAIDMRGVDNVTVRGNSVKDSDSFMVIKVAKYTQDVIDNKPGVADYETVYNNVKKEDVVHNFISGIADERDIYYSNTEDFSDREGWEVED